jgi:hypothetical protein
MALIPFEMTPEFLIPFLFIFSVVFGVLSFTNVFKGNKAVSAVVAFAMAAFAATNTGLVEIITQFLPTAIGFFVVVFFLAFLMKLFGLDKKKEDTSMEGMVLGGGVLFMLLGIGFYVYEQFPVEFPIIGGGENLIFTIGFLMIISIFWGVMKIGEGPKLVEKSK